MSLGIGHLPFTSRDEPTAAARRLLMDGSFDTRLVLPGFYDILR